MPELKIATSEEVSIPIDKNIILKGNLEIPKGAESLILFSHGSGSSRLSPRNNFVARKLNEAGFATLLFDLLTPEEDRIYSTRFDIELLIQRLLLATDWVKERDDLKNFELGYFGSSTGAASALGAASRVGDMVKAVVSRGGRPDLASPYLPDVKAASLFIVGGMDFYVIELNEAAFSMLHSQRQIIIVEEATHLFEEPGKLEEVAGLAIDWFKKYLK
jgi:putative phosphoribosyl transferase